MKEQGGMEEMKLFKIAFMFAAVLALTVAGTGAAMAETKITMNGSTTVLPIAQKAAEVYMQKNSGVSITVSGTGSGDGIKSIIDGTADIGNASRDMKDKEKKLAKEKGVNPVRHTVALDCIVPVVNPTNPVADLTLDQLKAVYTGGVKNWKEVGGEDKPIVVVSRDSSSGTFEVWNEKVLDKEKVRPDAQLQASNGAVAQTVAGNKYAIGYVGIGYLNPKLKGLKVNGVEASPATAKDESYPVARALFMFTKGEPTGEVKKFLDWLKSAEGQKIAEAEGFVAAY
jgi:phosphate transport system substrate-binding protein